VVLAQQRLPDLGRELDVRRAPVRRRQLRPPAGAAPPSPREAYPRPRYVHTDRYTGPHPSAAAPPSPREPAAAAASTPLRRSH
jgi:hypothetical protein